MTSLPTRVALAAAAGIFALIVLGTTLWFLGDALMLQFAASGFTAAGAAGLTGIVGLVLTALLGLMARLAMRPSRRPSVPASPAVASANGYANGIAADLGALVAQQLATASRAHPYTTMGAALAAGLAVGAVPELRKAITGLVKH